ncbi:MAG: alpha/beta hydrolase [Myxococcales bacterium]|nr:alpha/beta hydrolase [Myxococcales bacterium]
MQDKRKPAALPLRSARGLLGLLVLAGCAARSTTPHAIETVDGTVTPAGTATGSSPDAIARALVTDMSRGDFAKAEVAFGDAMRSSLPPPSLRRVWDDLVGRHGPFERVVSVRDEARGARVVVVHVDCVFDHGLVEVRVVVEDAQRVVGLWLRPVGSSEERPYADPDYVRRDRFVERALRIGAEPWILPAIASLPKVAGRSATVILVPGSGPLDHDETIGPNKPFADLAHGLASQGMVVVRYDKRTFAHRALAASHADDWTADVESVDDACAAVSAASALPEVDPARLFILGHSLGGYVLPRIARRCGGGAGLIGVAAPARRLEDVVLAQLEYLEGLAGGSPPGDRDRRLDAARGAVSEIRALTPASDPRGPTLLGNPRRYWISLIGYDPVSEARSLEQPMFFFQGGRDYQVSTQDLELWRSGLSSSARASGGPSATSTTRLYPALNHLLEEGSGRSTPAEYRRPGHVAVGVIEDIARWIQLGQL